MFAPKTIRTMVTKAAVCELLYAHITLLTDKGVISFTIEVFSLHPALRRVRFVL